MNRSLESTGELEFAVRLGCHEEVLPRLVREAQQVGLKACEPSELHLLIEEILTNVAKYSGVAERGGSAHIHWRMTPQRLELGFRDRGVPFDPLQVDDSVASDEERCNGGMGIILITSLADSIHYERTLDENRLTLTLIADQYRQAE